MGGYKVTADNEQPMMLSLLINCEDWPMGVAKKVACRRI